MRYVLGDDGLRRGRRLRSTRTPAPGLVEHDADEIAAAAAAVLAQVGDGAVALGIANQTETLVAWDADTGGRCTGRSCGRAGRASRRATGWPRTRAEVRARTGLLLDPTFSAKLAWLLEHAPAVAARRSGGRCGWARSTPGWSTG